MALSVSDLPQDAQIPSAPRVAPPPRRDAVPDEVAPPPAAVVADPIEAAPEPAQTAPEMGYGR